MNRIIHGDCLDQMALLEPDSIDTIITDPPYGLSFMGKDWDQQVPGVEYWEAALRVAKPGATLMAFGGTRTPTGGIVLDPFAGSGSTCIAAMLEGRDYIGIELDEKHVEICNARLEYWKQEKGMF